MSSVGGQAQYRVLFVDDDKLALKLAERVFHEDPEIGIVTTTSPSEAVVWAMSDPFDLIVADQRMPEMTGLQLLARMREVCPDAVLFLLTAHPELEVALKAINQGIVDQFVLKPWDADLMRAAIRSRLKEKRRQEEQLVADRDLRKKVEDRTRSEKLTLVAKIGERTARDLEGIEVGLNELLGAAAEQSALRGQVESLLEQVRSMRAGLLLHAESTPPQPTDADLELTIRRALARVRHRFTGDEQPAVSIAELPPIAHRSREVEQALVEVLLNAIDAIDEVGGGHLSVTAAESEGQVVIEISDEGSGIDGDVREKMFVPFVTTKAEAPGLGLTLVKRVITEHRGRFAIERTPERGTCFRIVLPANAPGKHVLGAMRRKS
jgi:signal transduction histidine kinase